MSVVVNSLKFDISVKLILILDYQLLEMCLHNFH